MKNATGTPEREWRLIDGAWRAQPVMSNDVVSWPKPTNSQRRFANRLLATVDETSLNVPIRFIIETLIARLGRKISVADLERAIGAAKAARDASEFCDLILK